MANLLRRSAALVLATALLLTSGAFVGCGRSSGPQPPVPKPAGYNWTLTFDAEFNQGGLESTGMSPCFDWNFADCTSTFNQGREHYQPSQVQIANGVAGLVAEPLLPPRNDGACYESTCTYKSGLLSTSRPHPDQPYAFTFTYGYVEARMKLPSTPGMFAAFWMLPANTNFVYDYEIDIVEYLAGKTDTVYQTYAYDNRTSYYRVNDLVNDTNGQCAKLNYSNDFHTYGVDWRSNYIAFYIDGTECGRFTPTAAGQIADQPMQIIIDLMVDTLWNRQTNMVTPAEGTTDRLNLDYLRVWQAI